MKQLYRCLLALLCVATSGCGQADQTVDRGEECYESRHGSRQCADGLECLWQQSIKKQVCAASGDESTRCDVDEDCNGKSLFCFGNSCETERDEDEPCVTNPQCRGELVCQLVYPSPPSRVCWTQEKTQAFSQCIDACLDNYYESCTACRERGEDDAGCDDICELTKSDDALQRETNKCSHRCFTDLDPS